MLGRFVGFSVIARRRAASFDFYRALGFEPVPVADGESAPYAALSDGVIAIGLHDPAADAATDTQDEPLEATFVRPHLQACVRTYRRLGIELELERLSSDRFNEVGFSDPSGQPLRVIEARTFSAGPTAGQSVAVCGTFFELSIATRSTGHSQTFWEALGFKPIEAAEKARHGWERLTGYGLTVGLHESGPFPTGLSFWAENLGARREYLQAKGFDVRAGPLFAHGRECVTLTAPEGTRLYLLEP